MKKAAARMLVVLVLLQNFAFSVPYAKAANTCSFTGGGDGTSFSDTFNWTSCGGTYPQPADDVVIPNAVSTLSTPTVGTNPGRVVAIGNYAYVTNAGSNSFTILDVSNPSSPTTVSTTSVGNLPGGLAVSGSYAYVANYNDSTIKILDISNPASPSVVSTTSVGANPQGIFLSGTHLYTANQGGASMTILDVSNPASPTVSSTTSIGSVPAFIYVSGSYAYISHFSDSLYIVNVSNPASPSVTSTINVGSGSENVVVNGNYAYVANYLSSTLAVVDVSTPASPALDSTIGTGSNAYGLDVVFPYALVANYGSNTLAIVDVTNSVSLQYIRSVNLISGPTAVDVSGGITYVTNYGTNKLSILDITPPFYTVNVNLPVTVNSLDVQDAYNVFNLTTDDLIVTGAVTNDGTINVGGNMLQVGGTLTNNGTLNGDTGLIRAAGDWDNTVGGFYPFTGTVELNGIGQTVYGNTTFYNLTKQTAVADTLTFQNGYVFDVTNTLTMNGASGNLLSLRSDAPGNQWYLGPTGSRVISYVDVQDSYNYSGVTVSAGTGSVDSGNNFDWSFAPPAPTPNTTDNSVVLSREAINAAATATISFTLADTLSTQLSMTFDSAFTGMDVTSASAYTPSNPGCMSNFVTTGANTFTADKSGCTGLVVISGVQVINPPTPGPYLVSWVNDDEGYAMVAIVDSDQINVTAQVDPSITFDLNANADNSTDAAPYSVPLGALTPGTVKSSDNAGVNSIWTNLETNATSGATVTVLSLNAALQSLSAPADGIPNAAGTMIGTTANYGLCVNAATTTAGTGTYQASTPYDTGTCTPGGGSNDVKALSTVSPTTIFDTATAPVTSASGEVIVNANADSTTAAHSDYSDTLTFVATGTF